MIFFLSYYDSILSWLISDVWIMDLSVVFLLREKSTCCFRLLGTYEQGTWDRLFQRNDWKNYQKEIPNSNHMN